MKAELEIRLYRAANGVVHASGTLAVPPFWCRWDGTTLWIVGSAATPVADDQISIKVVVGEGVVAKVRNVAATLIYAGSGEGTRLRTEIDVAEHATLIWQPEPVIVTNRAIHNSTTTISVAESSSILADEIVVFGRTDEMAGDLATLIELQIAGETAAITSFDTSLPGWSGPGGTNGAKVLGTRVTVEPQPPPSELPATEPTSTVLRPERGGAIATALGTTPQAVLKTLDRSLDLVGRRA